MTLLPVQDQVRNQGRNKIDDSMQSLLRPCCLSYFSSLFVCVVVAWLQLAVLLCSHLLSSCVPSVLSCVLCFPRSLVGMAAEQTWTGSDVEFVGSSIPPTDTEVEIVSSSEAWELVKAEKQEIKEEPAMEELTNTLKSVSLIEDEADFSADPPKEEAEQAPSTATDPPTTADQPADNSTDPTPPPATDTPMPPAADTPSKKPTVGLSSLKALEPLEATEGEGPKPTLVAAKPASKAAAVKKVAKRERSFLLEGQPTSGDECHHHHSRLSSAWVPNQKVHPREHLQQQRQEGLLLYHQSSGVGVWIAAGLSPESLDLPSDLFPPLPGLRLRSGLMKRRSQRIARSHCAQCQEPSPLRNLGTRIVAISSIRLTES